MFLEFCVEMRNRGAVACKGYVAAAIPISAIRLDKNTAGDLKLEFSTVVSAKVHRAKLDQLCQTASVFRLKS